MNAGNIFSLRNINFLISLLVLWLAACAVGPDFRAPDAPAVDRYTATIWPEKTVVSDAV